MMKCRLQDAAKRHDPREGQSGLHGVVVANDYCSKKGRSLAIG